MNKYLVKIAKDSEKNKVTLGKTLGYGMVGGMAGTAAQLVGGAPQLHQLFVAKRPGYDKDIIKKVLRQNPDLNVSFSAHKATGNKHAANALKEMASAGPFYANDATRQQLHGIHKLQDKLSGSNNAKHFANPLKKNFVNMKFQGKEFKDTSILMHELGHAKDFARAGKVTKGLDAVSRISHKVGAGTLVGAAMLQHEKTKDHAWAAPVVAAAPMLRSEAAANYHGYRMLSGAGASSKLKRQMLSTAGKNMLGYSAGALGTALLYKHLSKDKKD